MQVIAVDPGNTASAYAHIDADYRPLAIGKAPNADVLVWLANLADEVQTSAVFAIEMVASYGMPVGADVFETCVWIGRFAEAIDMGIDHNAETMLVYRRDVKLNLCGTSKAKDANIAQALVDRFAPGVANRGKGTMKAPGWFRGFHSDIWAAYALAVTVLDRLNGTGHRLNGTGR